MKHHELTYQIIGAAMEVHNNLGSGYQEVIYQRALEIELRNEGIKFTREETMDIVYKDEIIGQRRADFLIDDQIVVELKARSEIEGGHIVQTKNYLKIKELEIGLLFNFGRSSLETKRIYSNEEIL